MILSKLNPLLTSIPFLFLYILLIACSDDNSVNLISGEGVFITASGEATIEGELFLPQGEGPFPVIIIVPGSGNDPRQDLEPFVDIILPNGYGVYLYDKRGIGASTGSYPTETLEDPFPFLSARADDIIGILELMATHVDVDESRITLFGSSQGTWVNCIAYSKQSTGVHSIVMASGGAVSTSVEAYYEELIAMESTSIEAANEMLADFSGDPGYDPVPTLNAMNIPVLFIYGGKDDSHPTLHDREIINSLNKPNFEIHFYPNANHELVDVDSNLFPSDLFSKLGIWLIANK